MILFGVSWLFIFVAQIIFALFIGGLDSATLGWAGVTMVIVVYTTINATLITVLFVVVAAFRTQTRDPADESDSKADDNEVKTDSR